MTSPALKMIIVDKLQELAAAGHSMKEAATITGAHYVTVTKYAKDYKIPFRKKYRSRVSSSERNAEICRRYLDGGAQADLAKEFGISRERVRQICEKGGCVSWRKRHSDFAATVAGAVIRKGLTLQQTADMFGISRSNAYVYARKHGAEFARMTAEERAEIEAVVKAAITKTSINKASGGNRSIAEKARKEIRRLGLKSKGRSRWDDFSKRRQLLAKWREEGRGWSEIARLLTKHDGKKIGSPAIQNWAHRNMPELFASDERRAA